jgi:hypothetical protein
LKYFLEGVGGNKAFFDYLRHFKYEKLDIAHKFTGPVAHFYAKKLESVVSGKDFDMQEPFGDFRDTIVDVSHKAGEKMNKLGEKMHETWEKTGIEKKLKDYFQKE